MQRRKAKGYKHFISQFLLGIYVIALFSQVFHSHDSIEFSKDSFQKTEKKIDIAKKISNEEGCLACHFLATGNTLLPEEFSFKIYKDNLEVKQTLYAQEKIWSQTKYSFQLRGPPFIG